MNIKNKLRITAKDYLKAVKKADREIELTQQVGWKSTHKVHKSKKLHRLGIDPFIHLLPSYREMAEKTDIGRRPHSFINLPLIGRKPGGIDLLDLPTLRNLGAAAFLQIGGFVAASERKG